MKNSTLIIEGMSCSGCARIVEKALKELKGVDDVSVNLEEGTAEVQYDEQKTDTVKFSRAIDEAGYKLNGKDNYLDDIK